MKYGYRLFVIYFQTDIDAEMLLERPDDDLRVGDLLAVELDEGQQAARRPLEH